MRRRIVAVLALLLAGCATQTRHPVTGPPLTAVTPDEAKGLLRELALDLKDVSLAQVGGKSLEPKVSERQLEVKLAMRDLFESGNGQVRAEALKPLTEIAEDVAARGGCVVHVIALSTVDDDLAERRAASVADNFAHHGIPPTRVRIESRLDEKGGDRIVIVLRAVIIGRESPAWTPPALAE
jgi:hypothetical protein